MARIARISKMLPSRYNTGTMESCRVSSRRLQQDNPPSAILGPIHPSTEPFVRLARDLDFLNRGVLFVRIAPGFRRGRPCRPHTGAERNFSWRPSVT